MEILTKTPITGHLCNPGFIILVEVVFVCIGIIGGILGCARFGTIRDKISTPIMWVAVIGLIGGIIWMTLNEIIPGAPTGRYKYEVKILDTTSFKEVTDNYKIIDNLGQIWVLEDKDD